MVSWEEDDIYLCVIDLGETGLHSFKIAYSEQDAIAWKSVEMERKNQIGQPRVLQIKAKELYL